MTQMDPVVNGATNASSPANVAWKRRLMLFAGVAGIVAVAGMARWMSGPAPAAAENPLLRWVRKDDGAAKQPTADKQPSAAAGQPTTEAANIVAVINGQPITRDDLARECITHYGEEVLESLVNKYLIAEHCSRQNLVVTQADVEAEIQRSAERFGMPVDQWLKMLKDERGITSTQYANDIVWPTVALRKLAAERIEPTERELVEAYESLFGPAIQARLIACDSQQAAEQVRQMALANPDDFGNLAKEHSADVNSASAKGLIQPIRLHMGDPNIERVAFQLQPGQISEIIPVGSQYIILKCETHIPPRKDPISSVEKVLRDSVRDKKMRLVAGEVFQELQSSAVVESVFNDPQKSAQHPGAAALINGRPIAMVELADECIKRYGVEVLEGTINRRLLEQELRKRTLEVTQAEVDAEIARAAVAMGKTLQDGSADINAWIKEITENQGVDLEMYVHDAVWPTVALKKLVGDRIDITEEDLRKGYEANYGPRVRCRAIVLDNLRRAQEVWDKARTNPTVENFGQLAEQYSVESSSRALQGEVPPIQKHGGQPLLEQEAFTLHAGEVSSIVQVVDKFVILYCEGFTTPTAVEFNEVRQNIYDDIHEKKVRIAMAQEFARMQEAAQIDNFLAGTSQDGKKPAAGAAPSATPSGSTPSSARAGSALGGQVR